MILKGRVRRRDRGCLGFILNKMKVVVVHGCPGSEEKVLDANKRTYDKNWIPWLKRNLKFKGVDCLVPLMPEPWRPNYEDWKKKFENIEISEEDILIGHSCGCSFLVRWLGETGKKVKKLILVAPWKIADLEKYESQDIFEIREKFYNYEINKVIVENVSEIIYFTADDEDEDGKKSLEIFRKVLGGEFINLENHGHFCLGDMGTEEFPELLDEILK
jgi:predicted alpha/beta hydrolase family esterase